MAALRLSRSARRTAEQRRQECYRHGPEDARTLEFGDNRRDLERVGHDGLSLRKGSGYERAFCDRSIHRLGNTTT